MAATAQRRASVSSSGSNIYDDDTIVNPSTTVGRRDQQAIGGNGPATSASPRNQGKSAKAVDTSNNFGNYGTGGQYVHMGSGQMIINAGSNSIFQSMVNGAFVEDDEEHASRLSNAERRAQFVAGRVPTAIDEGSTFAPAVNVVNPRLKEILRRITEECLFLDNGFAEYFAVVAKSYGQNRIKRALDNIRQVMARRQQRSSTVPGGDVYLGDLGHYCEEIASSWDSETASDRPKFSVWHKDDQQKFCYLQYAIEVPYWELMLTLFAERHDNRADMTRVAIFRILESIKFSVLTEKKRLLAVLQELGQGDIEDLDAIVAGIDARIKALEGVQGGLDIKLLLETSGEKPQPAKELSNQLSVHQKELAHSQRNETALLITLVFVFLAGAIVPGYKSFSISMKEDSKPGTYADSNFWGLVQSSIMAVMANVVTILPHVRKSWLSPAYSLMWFFFISGILCALISMGLYLLCSPAWSSVLSFLGSMASAACVLVFTQATAREASRWNRYGRHIEAKKEKAD